MTFGGNWRDGFSQFDSVRSETINLKLGVFERLTIRCLLAVEPEIAK